MMERLASDTLTRLVETMKLYAECAKAVPVGALPALLKVIVTARELARETEEELQIAEMQLAVARMGAGNRPRQAAHIDQEGNVIRLPFQPRIVRTINPGGGDAA